MKRDAHGQDIPLFYFPEIEVPETDDLKIEGPEIQGPEIKGPQINRPTSEPPDMECPAFAGETRPAQDSGRSLRNFLSM